MLYVQRPERLAGLHQQVLQVAEEPYALTLGRSLLGHVCARDRLAEPGRRHGQYGAVSLSQLPPDLLDQLYLVVIQVYHRGLLAGTRTGAWRYSPWCLSSCRP